MEHEIELLAPAGSWDAMEAAVNAGADAIYLAGKAFGARAYADNFDREEMSRAIRFCHLHHVRMYVTVNTLVDDREMAELEDYLVYLYNAGVDGIIVQDLGVIRAARRVVPGLPLHASTQMTVTNSAGVCFTAGQGMVRAVPARELSLKDLEKAAETGLEIEAFIHGALCVCYSGQCLMSSLIGGRSGNRGRCAQPCRLPYTLVNGKGSNMLAGDPSAGQYLLSPKDMNTLAILPRMIEAGVVSYKIEGRMKRPEYVAVVVDAYRRAIDSYKAGHYHVPERDLANIEQIFNRDFTTAYLEKNQGRQMMSDRRPNNRGVLVGRVHALNKERTQAVLKLEKDIHRGDGLEFWVKVGGRVGTSVDNLTVDGRPVGTAAAGSLAAIDVPRGVRLNDRVFRTLDSDLMAYAGRFYGEKNKKRIPVTARVTARLGEPLVLTLRDHDGNEGRGVTTFRVEAARKHALDEQTLRKQVDRLGTTEYSLEELELEVGEGLMCPVSELNEARRQACESLDEARLDAFLPHRVPVRNKGILAADIASVEATTERPPYTGTEISVWVDTLDKVQAALDGGADWILFGGDRFASKNLTFTEYARALEMVRRAGRHIAFGTSRIVKEPQLRYYETFLRQVAEAGPDLLCIHNLGLWQLARDLSLPVPLWADMSLNIFNSEALRFWQEAGAAGAVPSIELNLGQVEHLAKSSPLPLECLVQGPIEMMVSEYCAGGSFLGHLDKGACTFRCGEPLYLRDRKDAEFRLAGDQFCRMHVLNSQDLSVLGSAAELARMGIARLRIDGRMYEADRIRELTGLYKEALAAGPDAMENLPGTTRGHYFRGVL
jgi:putative protease